MLLLVLTRPWSGDVPTLPASASHFTLDTLEDSAFSIDACGPKYPPKILYFKLCNTEVVSMI